MEPTGLCPWTSTALVVGAMEEKEYRQRQEHVASGGASAPEPPRATRSQSDPYNFLYFPQFFIFPVCKTSPVFKKGGVPSRVKKKRMGHGFPKTCVTSFVKSSFLECCSVGKYFFDCKVLAMSLI